MREGIFVKAIVEVTDGLFRWEFSDFCSPKLITNSWLKYVATYRRLRNSLSWNNPIYTHTYIVIRFFQFGLTNAKLKIEPNRNYDLNTDQTGPNDTAEPNQIRSGSNFLSGSIYSNFCSPPTCADNFVWQLSTVFSHPNASKLSRFYIP